MNIREKQLNNGLTQIVVPMEDTPTATVLVMVNAGTRFETKENNGVSHFLEHMCFKGTKKRPNPRDIATELDALGTESNAFTWYEYTGYYGKTRSGNARDVLEILADIYKESLLQSEEIKKEAGVITEEIKMYQDLPMRHVHSVFRNQIFGDRPAGWEVLGPEDTVQSLDQSDLASYRERLYVPEATTVVVVGGVDESEITTDIADHFSDLSPGERKEADQAVYDDDFDKVAEEAKDSDQTHLILGAPAVNYDSEDLPAVEILSTVLGRGMSSRLFHRVRDQMGACYYVNSSTEYYSDSGLIKIATGVDTKRVTEVVEAIVGEIKKLQEAIVGGDELEKAKEYLSGNYLLNHESTNQIANELAVQSVLGVELEKPEAYVERLQGVTAKQVQEAADTYLAADKLRISAVGPGVSSDELCDILS